MNQILKENQAFFPLLIFEGQSFNAPFVKFAPLKGLKCFISQNIYAIDEVQLWKYNYIILLI